MPPTVLAVIVGLHGAGLANSVFCPRGIKVVEVLNKNYLNGTLGQLAVDCGHVYYPLILEELLEEGWSVDVERLLAGVLECLDDEF